MHFLYEKSILELLIITLLFGGGTSWMTGRAYALSWGSRFALIAALLGLALAVRFVHFAVFEGKLFNLYYFLVDCFFCLLFGGLGYFYTRTNQLVDKYWWLYERTSPLSAKKRTTPLMNR